jgi:tetratricopeptide (TPR) repeat protein
VPETKPTARRRTDRDENERELRELALFLEGPDGFRLGLATYDVPASRELQLGHLASALVSRPVYLTRLDLSHSPDEKLLLRRLRRHLDETSAPEGKHPAIMLVGLEATLDYRKLVPEPREGLAILHNANVQRDAFPRLCPVPVVIWLNPTATATFALEAPDLWHWRSATFRFSGPAKVRNILEQGLLWTPPAWTESLPRAGKRTRVAVLRDLLLDLEHSPDSESSGAKARRAALLTELGVTCAQEDPGKARAYYEEALALAREIGDQAGEATVLINLGETCSLLGQTDEAIQHLKESVTVARAIRAPRIEGYALGALGVVHFNQGQPEKAISYYEQSLKLLSELGDRRGIGSNTLNLANAYTRLGQLDKAASWYERSLAVARGSRDRSNEAAALTGLGSILARSGQADKAIGYYEQALAIFREIGHRHGEGNVLGNLGEACYQLGQVDRAMGYYQQQLSIAREIGDRRSEGIALANLGEAYAQQSQPEQGAILAEQALRIGEAVQDPRLVEFASSLLHR